MAKTSLNKSDNETITTEFGKGFFPLLIRAWARSLIVADAMFRGWPITAEIAAAEMDEGKSFLKRVIPAHLDMMSVATQQKVMNLIDSYSYVHADIARVAGSTPEALLDSAIFNEPLKNLTQRSFELMAALDRETLGLKKDETDAGIKL